VPESLASSAATPAKPPSVQRSALTVSCAAGKMIVDGCVGFKLPDYQNEMLTAIFRRFWLPSEEVLQ
jgi:hypothetical protein